MVWISMESVVISLYRSLLHLFDSSLFSFLLIWVVVCLFCWSFLKTGSWIYWFFEGSLSPSVLCLYLLQFCSDFSYFLVFCEVLSFFLSCSSSSFDFDDRVLILNLSLLLVWTFIAINFPLDTALNVSQRFWYIVSLFSSV